MWKVKASKAGTFGAQLDDYSLAEPPKHFGGVWSFMQDGEKYVCKGKPKFVADKRMKILLEPGEAAALRFVSQCVRKPDDDYDMERAEQRFVHAVEGPGGTVSLALATDGKALRCVSLPSALRSAWSEEQLFSVSLRSDEAKAATLSLTAGWTELQDWRYLVRCAQAGPQFQLPIGALLTEKDHLWLVLGDAPAFLLHADLLAEQLRAMGGEDDAVLVRLPTDYRYPIALYTATHMAAVSPMSYRVETGAQYLSRCSTLTTVHTGMYSKQHSTVGVAEMNKQPLFKHSIPVPITWYQSSATASAPAVLEVV